MHKTLPRSWRQKNLITSSREITDPEELAVRKHLIETKSPAELANFHSISDFPVPSKIKNFMSPSEKIIAAQKNKKGESTEEEEGPKEPWSLYGTLARSMRETKLVTSTREMEDLDELARRRELIQARTPTQLAEFHGFGDIPVPSRIQNLYKGMDRFRSKEGHGANRSRSESLPRNFSGTVYATLPRSWKEQNLVLQVKVDQDPEVVAQRRALIQEKTPAQLAQISSMADLPIPTALENFLKSSGNKSCKVEEENPSKPLLKK